MRGHRRSIDGAFVTALLALAAVPLWPVYESSALIVAGVGAIVLGGIIATVGAARRFPPYAVAALTALAFVVFGVPLAVPGQAAFGVLPTAEGLRSLVLGAATAWKQMLSVDLPLGSYEALLVPTFIAVLVTSVVGLSLALRVRAAGWALVAPAGLLAFAIAFGARTGHRPVLVGGLFVIVALAWAIVASAAAGAAARGSGSGRGSGGSGSGSGRGGAGAGRGGRALAALALVVVCTVAGSAAVAAWAPAGPRQVLRAAVEPPFDPHHFVSPLVTYRNSVLAPGATTSMLTVTGLPTGARLRVATLDDYDGQVFAQGSSASSGSFTRVASTIAESGNAGTRATVSVVVDGYSDVWLPTAGTLTSIAFGGSDGSSLRDSFFYDRATSSAAVLGGVARGDHYTMTTIVPPTPSAAEVTALRPGQAKQPKATGVPRELIAAAKQHTAGATTPGAELEALASWLRSGYVSDSGPDQPFSAAGHSANRLSSLVTATPMLGDAEQYAPTLALLARQVGFPSRVVVGYAPTRAQETTGRVTLTGADLTAWVEVETANGRWVTVDPNPVPRPVPDDTTKESRSVAQPQTVLPPPPPSAHDSAVTQNRDSQKTKHDAGLPFWLTVLLTSLRVAGIVLLIAAIVLAPLWGIALARWLRRRRRRRRDLDARVVTGAWLEIVDAAVDHGFVVPRAATRTEVAALVGTSAVAVLAERAERSVFSSQGLDAAGVDDFWASMRLASRGLRVGESRWARLRYHLTARSLAGRVRAGGVRAGRVGAGGVRAGRVRGGRARRILPARRPPRSPR